MKIGYKLGLAAIAASISFVGCGSGSDSIAAVATEIPTETPVAKVTGQFVDTYVAGLNYECSSGTTGITNNMGEYTCNVGDTVEFSLGGYLLGSVMASSGIVTPEALYPNNPEAALNVAQVIQSLDTDPTDDIITIPDNFTGLDDVTTTPEDENFDALIEDVLDVPLVTEEEAQAHLDETEFMLLLAGKTFYTVGSDWIDRSVFNADLTSVTWEQIVGGTGTGTDTLLLDGGQLTVISSEDGSSFTVAVAEVTADYLLLNIVDLNGAVVEQNRLYFDQATAEAYYDSFQHDLAALTVGKTIYFLTSDGLIGYRIYAEDGTYTGGITLADGTSFAVSGTYEIEDDILTITRTSPSDFLIVLKYISYIDGVMRTEGTIDGDVFQTYAFNSEAERDAYVVSLQSALLREMLAGNTWYSPEPLTVTFNADVTSIEFGDGGTDTVSLDGMILTHSEGSEVITIVNETTLIFSYNGVEAGVTFTLQPEPDATESALLREMLAGNTWESTDTTLTFNTDVTSVMIDDMDGSEPFPDTVSLDGMTLTHSEGSEVITIVDETTLIFNTETFTLVPLT